jgi:peptidoglycan/xylan/chitin deacetylase (PgdA/CDA1 family)
VIQEERANASRKESPHPLTVPIQGEELEVAAADSEEQAKRMVADLPYTDEVKEEVENSAADLSEELNEAGLAREPQSAAVVPSVGASGNIDGTSFARGTWAITFDDGPHPLITEKDLVNLQASNTPATFFWLAKNVEVETNLVKKVQAAGFPVEDHSWSHPRLDQAEDLARLHTNLDREINQSFALDTKIYGQKPRFFRCPYGAGLRNPVIRGMIAKNGMIHVSWNVDSLDWHDANPASVQRRVEQQMAANGRGIILFHDIHTPALTVLPALVSKNAGKIRWVSIPEIVDELNGKK